MTNKELSLNRTLYIGALLGVLLLVLRIAYTHELSYGALVWNVFLAWVPYITAKKLNNVERLEKKRPLLMTSLFLVWLAFLPNAPYIFTDFMHLDRLYNSLVPIWFDITLVGIFAIVGLLFGLKSLYWIQKFIRNRVGALTSWIVVVIVTFLSGFGIYLGRFPRWNSWNAVTNPIGLTTIK